MADAATVATNPSLYKNQSLIDELNAALATGGDDRAKAHPGARRRSVRGRRARLFQPADRVVDDVLQKLCADIEVKTRARLARRLAHIDNAPAATDRSLAFDDAIAVADAGPDPLAAAQRCRSGRETPPPRARTICSPSPSGCRLSERVTDILVERGNRKVIHKSRRQYGGALFARRLRQADPLRPARPQANARARPPSRPAPPIFSQAS